MQSIRFNEMIRVRANACIGGAMEKEGPIGAYLDAYDETGKFDGETWEESESRMLRQTIECAIKKAGKETTDIDYLFCGDLLRQMTASSFGVKLPSEWTVCVCRSQFIFSSKPLICK